MTATFSNVHPDPHRLALDHEALGEDERTHLSTCPRCRIDARIFRGASTEPARDLPGLDEARQELATQRTVLSQSMEGSLVSAEQTLRRHTAPSDEVTSSTARGALGPQDGLGRYQIGQWLGLGRLGVVYSAVDTNTGQAVAVKMLTPGLVDRPGFVEDWLEFHRLEHPGLVRQLALVLEAGAPFMVMERIDGLDFVGWIQGDGTRRPGGAESDSGGLRPALWQLAAGLSVLHDLGRAHGHLKPGNLRVDVCGRVVLLDPQLGPADPDARRAFDRPWLAPEVIDGGPISQAGDWYSVGVFLHEALMGRLPGPSHAETAYALRKAGGSSDDLAALCVDLLHPDPARRPRDAAVLRRLGSPAPASAEQQLVDAGPLGRGGMAEVRRVLDPVLGRTIARKVMLPEIHQSPSCVARFLEEARVTAQLEHPGVVPVHALGRLPDGRPCFTMKEVRGATLGDRIKEVHSASPDGAWGITDEGWTLRKLVEVFRRVCETLAYAHSRGVIHRDVKPANIMTGDFGEVLVLDWGLARARAGQDRPEAAEGRAPIQRGSPKTLENPTEADHISGTPAYMAPEQARPDRAEVHATTDVYALGAVLYVLLTGRLPYQGSSMETICKLVFGPPPPPRQRDDRTGGPVPVDLEQICLRAMARDPAERYVDAGMLGKEIAAWLAGTRRRERALEFVARAEALQPMVRRLRQEAGQLRSEGDRLLEAIDDLAGEDEKLAGWTLQDEAAERRREAERKGYELEQLFHAALTRDPVLGEAHEGLARHHRKLHAEAEAGGDWPEAARQEVALRAHNRGEHDEYLQGTGALSLSTDPPGAVARLFRYEGTRRLELVEQGVLGSTPLEAVRLEMGCYLVILEAPGRQHVRYPVWIQRLHHCDARPPGASALTPIRLPPAGEFCADDVPIPAGWFTCGGDQEAPGALPTKRIWLDAFVMRRFPVTNGEYLEFLNDLVDRGEEEEASRRVPRQLTPRGESAGNALYGRDASGHFLLQEDSDGDLWEPDWPVTMVNMGDGLAYARWLTARTGLPWRIPSEIEWEKAAVGVDVRAFPWGERFDPTWCNMGRSRRPHRMLDVVDSFPTDVSPYGVRGVAGNVRDPCIPAPLPLPERWSPPRETTLPVDGYVVRGGSWWAVDRYCRLCARSVVRPDSRYPNAGIRLVRSLGAAEEDAPDPVPATP